jgi:FkbM family methyltransferase
MKKVFLEIGSCDYDTFLPLIKTGRWFGILIEPTEHYFNSLKSKSLEMELPFDSYSIENVAIGDREEVIEMNVCLPEEGEYSRGLSFVSDSNVPHLKEASNQNWIKQKTKMVTLDSIIDKYNLKRIDVLKIDTEGYEEKILSKYSWKILPDTLIVERAYSDSDKLNSILTSFGYSIVWDEWNLFAIR